MRLTITSKKLDEVFEFWAPNDGGYIRRETDGKPGTLGRQICERGYYSGSTISTPADESKFREICRSWYRAYYKKNRSI